MLGFEWKKLYKDRFAIVILAVFLLVALFLTFIKASTDTTVDTAACKEVFELYENDPMAFAEEKAVALEQFSGWDDPAAEKLVWYTLAEQQAEYPAQYRQKLSVIIRNATNALREYDAMRMKEDSYLYVMQTHYRDIYTSLSEVDFCYEYVCGWDLYFSYDFVTLMLVVLLLAVIPRYVCMDSECKMTPVTRSAKHGRGRSVRAKLGVAFLFTCGATVLFSFLPLVPIACVSGLSSLSNSAHVLDAFVYLPFDWTIGELLFVSFGLRLAAMLCLTAVLFFLCACIRSYFGAVSVGTAIIALDLFLGKTGGIFYLALPERSLDVYETVNTFTYCMPSLYLVIGIVLLAFAVLTVAGIPLFLRLDETYRYAKKMSVLSFAAEPRTLFGQELKKLFVKRGALAVLLLALIARCGISAWQYKTEFDTTEYFYNVYMETLQGELNEEKRQFLTEEILQQKSLSAMTESDILLYPEEQRDSVRQTVMQAGAKLNALERIEHQIIYVENTPGAYLVADTGWQALFSRPFDFVFYAAFLLVAAGCVAKERDLHAENVLRASRFGRQELYRAKTLALLVCFVLMYVGCTVVDMLFFLANYELSCTHFPAQSVSALSFANEINLGTFGILSAVGCFLTAVCFVFACIGLSAWIRQTNAVLAVSASIVFVPFFAVWIGFSELGFAAVSQLAAFGGYPVLANGTLLWGAALVVWLFSSILLYVIGRNRFCKTGGIFQKTLDECRKKEYSVS